MSVTWGIPNRKPTLPPLLFHITETPVQPSPASKPPKMPKRKLARRLQRMYRDFVRRQIVDDAKRLWPRTGGEL